MKLVRTLGMAIALAGAGGVFGFTGVFDVYAKEGPVVAYPPAGAEVWKMTLKDFLQLVRDRNERIQFQNAEWAIKQEGVYSAKGVFEPSLMGDYRHFDTAQRQTVREIVSTQFTPLFIERSNDYDIAVESLAPTGAQLKLGYNVRDFKNNFDVQFGVPREVKSFMGISATQPLLKNAGIQTNKAGIRVAEEDAGIAFQNYREQMMQVIAEAIVAYWDLRLAQEKQNVRQDSVLIAETILNDNIVRVRTGKMAATEVLEAKAGLALRRSFLIEARQAIVTAVNNVRTLFSTSADDAIPIEAADPLALESLQEADLKASLARAYRLRAEYLAANRKLEREDIRTAYAKNQTYPELDLKGSYGLNGLATDFQDSWKELWDPDFRTWEVGFQFSVPLSGGRQTRGEFNAAKKRQEQALLELKAIEVAVVNSVDTAIQQVENTASQVSYFSEAVGFNKLLLKAELARLDAGKSNSRLVLEKEEDLLRAREAELDSLVNYQRAVVELEMAEGSLLLSNGIEIMEGEF